MLLDEELNIGGLGWKEGDYFKIEKVNGRMMLRKVEKIEAFLICGNE